jgi:transcriptional regulator with XRE-family HTH domain
MSDAVSPYYEALGDRLRALRLRGGESLLDVQDRSAGRWQAGTLRAWEAGERRPQAETVTELAGWYDVPAAWLLTGQGNAGDFLIVSEPAVAS